MLRTTLGPDVFVQGVGTYLKRYAHGNSEASGLWEALSEASGRDVGAFMQSWIQRIGFPVITVEEMSEGLKLRQNRFLSSGDVKPEDDETIWQIPLELKTVDANGRATVDHSAILGTRESSIPLMSDFYKLNTDTTAVCRVLYPPARLVKLGHEAAKGDAGHLSTADRIGLVQDAAVVAQAGLAKTSTALELIRTMSAETDHLVLEEMLSALSVLYSIGWEQDASVREAIRAFQASIAVPLVRKLGFEPASSESSDVAELRALVIAVAAAAKDEPTLAEIDRRFARAFDQADASAVPGDLRGSIYSHGVRSGGAKAYEHMLAVLRDPPSPQARQAALRALATPDLPELRERTLNYLLDGTIREQDLIYVRTRSRDPADDAGLRGRRGLRARPSATRRMDPAALRRARAALQERHLASVTFSLPS